jgi:hypothetical protein
MTEPPTEPGSITFANSGSGKVSKNTITNAEISQTASDTTNARRLLAAVEMTIANKDTKNKPSKITPFIDTPLSS